MKKLRNVPILAVDGTQNQINSCQLARAKQATVPQCVCKLKTAVLERRSF